GIKGIDIQEGSVRARRETPSGFEVYQFPLPAVLTVKEGINLPRYPTLSGRLRSKKVEVGRHDVEVTPGGQRMIRLQSPPEQEVRTEVLADATAAVDVLDRLGVL
ncbi:MAG TPA: electron transfer flavoprotein beta subunit/FixA family protein, partial [Acidimicrobiia bacterium]|nr:electron transfer flavoprotein beta subunit/FixA family protein [Acidimicrobiia bacterium]